MKQRIQILPSGISFIDKAWGGLYRGATYLLLGSHKSGRTTFALEFAKECAEQKEVCLFFTTRRPKDLILQAASINIDLQGYISQNSVILVQVESPSVQSEKEETDSSLSEYLKDMVDLASQYQPSKIVFDELTPFIGYKDLNFLDETFFSTMDKIEELTITSIFLLGDPISSSAKKIVDVLAKHSAGIIYLQSKSHLEDKIAAGTMTINPNIGHSEGKFKADYHILPGKGFSFELQTFASTRNFANGHLISQESKYTKLSEILTPKDEYLLSNLYSYDDFSLIINNQIAYFKSTGQVFTLVAFKLDEAAERMGLFSISQLRNAVRLSIEKKDKLCVVQNKVIVLLTKEDQKDITGFVSRVKSNLTTDDYALQMRIMSYISVYALRVDESVSTSEDLLKELRSDEQIGKNIFRFS